MGSSSNDKIWWINENKTHQNNEKVTGIDDQFWETWYINQQTDNYVVIIVCPKKVELLKNKKISNFFV